MADTKLTGLPETTSLSSNDILYAVTDTATTPVSKYIKQSNLKSSLGLTGTNSGDQIVPSNTPAVTNQFINAYDNTTGAFTQARPTWANIDKTTSPINDLSDVVISSPTSNQVLNYNSTGLYWENKTLATQMQLFENANQINNSTNGYGGLSDGWSDSGAFSTQGGFPTVNWNGIWDKGTFTGIWYLTEASGSALDAQGVNNLTESSTIASSGTTALMSKSRQFNGTQRFSGTVASGNVVGNQTFIAYIRPSVLGVAQAICGYSDGTRQAYIGLTSSNTVAFQFTGLSTSSITSNFALEVDKWYLIIASYNADEGLLRLFVNGMYKQIAVTGTHVVTTNNTFQIGSVNSTQPFNGYMNCVAHVNNNGWDKEKMLTLFAQTLYQGVRIYRTDTGSEITNFTFLGREQMHRFVGRTVTLSAEIYCENANANGKVTLYGSGMGNRDSSVVTSSGVWEERSVTVTIPSSLPELYIDLRSSSGTTDTAIWFRNIRLNYGSVPMGYGVHHPEDWRKFPRLLMLDFPVFNNARPYQYEENRWYSFTYTTAPTGGTGTLKFKFIGNHCYLKGQITQTHASTTWSHTLPIALGTLEDVYTKHIKIQNNAGTIALGNWSQLTGGSVSGLMYATIANGTWSATSGAKVAQLDSVDYEID